MKKEFYIFFTALSFFTRIPVPKWAVHHPDYLKLSTRYFPLIGILVGSVGAGVYYGATFFLPNEIAILLSIVSTIYTTGAFHEDGFADVCDGFGGGWTKDKILLIMKDSRLGTYGTIGLITILAIKYSALTHLNPLILPWIIIAGHSSSRFIATTLIYTHPYVRDTNDAKAKPTATSMSSQSLFISMCFGLLPFLVFGNYWIFLTLIPMYLSKMFLAAKFKKWIGGQTGDCAGAVQQLSEVVFYLSLLILLSWTSI